MLHYHVWFNLKPGIPEAEGLQTIRTFLATLTTAGEASGFQLLRNQGSPPRSKLPHYHALVEFADQATFEAAMKAQAQRGIFQGPHGAVVDAVQDFHVEIFTSCPA